MKQDIQPKWKLFLAVMAVALCWSDYVAAAQPAPSRPENRWLIVVETSKAMHARSGPALSIAASLVASSMNGQMQHGDTLGVWTFNDSVKSGEFPLQIWTPDSERRVARLVFQFVEGQTFAKSSRMDRMLTEVQAVIKASEFITVILITDGEHPIKGTPFDEKINAAYKTWGPEQRKQKVPFVTLLRAARGEITHAIVTTPPWTVEWPPLPPELKKPDPVAPAASVIEPVEKPPMAEPLILSGRKSEAPAPQEPPKAEENAATTAAQAAPNAGATGQISPSAAQVPPPRSIETVTSPASTPRVVYTAPADATPESRVQDEPQVQTAVSTPSARVGRSSKTLMVTLAGGGVALIMILLLARRKRRSRGSLITRSLEGRE